MRTCMFCGSTPLSREHIIARWVTDYLPTQEAERGQARHRIYGPGGTKELALPTRSIPERFTDHEVRAVCRSCNHGWMNATEIAARPALTALLTGEATELSSADCRAVAVWATKTAMVAEVTDLGSAGYHSLEHRWLFEHGEPPRGTSVWVGSQEINDEWSLRYEHAGLLLGVAASIDQPCDTQLTTLGLGAAVFVVMHAASGYPPPPPFESLHGAVVRLWPDPAGVEWPPETPLPSWLIWQIARHFQFILL